MSAPWAAGIQAPSLPRTGTPVAMRIAAEPALPPVERDKWPATWQPAKKMITCEEDVQRALRGSSLRRFVAFTMSLNAAVRGCPLSAECAVTPRVQALLDALARLSALVDATPPAATALRYGNPAYRDWARHMRDAAPELLYDVLGDALAPALPELLPYFLDAFGNATRIDYGTGHETNFVALLFCLFALGALGPPDERAAVLRVLPAYLDLMRKVQTTYWLEPAGSHGVWGLDDYHFFPFIFGSSQLVDHPVVRPRSITNDDILEGFGDDYLYLAAVAFVRRVKKGPLHETSPMLYDISGVASWAKVNEGMFKMYQVELLSKFPIMQHFLWGSLLPFPGD